MATTTLQDTVSKRRLAAAGSARDYLLMPPQDTNVFLKKTVS